MSDPNVDRVRLKLAERSARGLAKYGVDTTRTDLTRLQWLQHAQDEALDLAVYLERLMDDERAGFTYEDGRQAGLAGKKASDNPFGKRVKAHEVWESGRMAGQAELAHEMAPEEAVA